MIETENAISLFEVSLMNQDRYNAERLRKRMWITIAVALLALLTVILSTMSGAFNFHKGLNSLPDLTGMTEADAIATIERLKGHASVSYEASTAKEGTVIRQGIPAGDAVTPNSTVSIVVSSGKPDVQPTAEPQVLLPSFVGLSMELARRNAEEIDVNLVEDGYVYDDTIPYGSIVEQEPAVGAKVTQSMIVKVKLSAGPETVRYTITVEAGAGGSVSPGTTTVVEGEDISFTITPNEGYMIDHLIVDGVEVHSLDRYSFLTVDSDHTLSVTFREQRGMLEEFIDQFFGGN